MAPAVPATAPGPHAAPRTPTTRRRRSRPRQFCQLRGLSRLKLPLSVQRQKQRLKREHRPHPPRPAPPPLTPILEHAGFPSLDRVVISGTPARLDSTPGGAPEQRIHEMHATLDRKSTRLNSSHLVISYA